MHRLFHSCWVNIVDDLIMDIYKEKNFSSVTKKQHSFKGSCQEKVDLKTRV